MTNLKFAKTLSANDAGSTGSHQAGILVPKTSSALLAFFPPLNAGQKNPDSWITCIDDSGYAWQLRYIYYNNKLHDAKGTRNEYRITCLTPFLKQEGAKAGDQLVFEATSKPLRYRISLQKSSGPSPVALLKEALIKLRGWRQVH